MHLSYFLQSMWAYFALCRRQRNRQLQTKEWGPVVHSVWHAVCEACVVRFCEERVVLQAAEKQAVADKRRGLMVHSAGHAVCEACVARCL